MVNKKESYLNEIILSYKLNEQNRSLKKFLLLYSLQITFHLMKSVSTTTHSYFQPWSYTLDFN